MNSVNTFRPSSTFVIAWIMPMGTIQTRAMMMAMKNAHHERCVGYASTVARDKAIITTKRTRYHQFGASRYFRIILV